MIKLISALMAVSALSFSVLASAEPALYSTGPGEDSAFIRFVNASTAPLDVIAKPGQEPLRLVTKEADGAKGPVSDLYSVDSGKPVKGTLVSGENKLAIDLKIKPGEFVSVFAFPDGDGVQQAVVRESPDEFNGLKASLAFYNVDKSCADATLRAIFPGKDEAIDLFKSVPVNSAKRRFINSVNLSVQLVCANANTGTPLDLGLLEPGKRYSVLLVPSAAGSRLLKATDTLSN